MSGSGMAVVGLTGGVASGKSSVAERLAERGAAVVDADAIAREVVEPGEPALERIRETFGDAILDADGRLDRTRLGARVFADPEQRKALERITHPAILKRLGERLGALRSRGDRWAVVEAALIVDGGLHRGMHELIVVEAPEADRLERLQTRDGLDAEEARRRLASQTDDATRREAATIRIVNDGALDTLRERTDGIFDTLVERYGLPTSA